jgi:Tfp pilus assembly protein PilX
MMHTPEMLGHRQNGSALIVSLIMLTLLTLFVLSAIGSSTVNLKIAGNTQVQDEARAAAQRGIERVISSYANFDPTPTGLAATPISVNNDITNQSGDYSVTVAAPVCTRAEVQLVPKTTDCLNGIKSGVACTDTVWEVRATATDTRTAASQTVVQGINITFSPGINPPAASGCQAP